MHALFELADQTVGMHHATTDELDAALGGGSGSPAHAGIVEMIVRRPAPGEREVVDEAELDSEKGLVGDDWLRRAGDRPFLPTQLTVMNSRVVGAVAGDRDRWALAGDQIYVDFDLSVANLPPGTRLSVGSAVVEVSEVPHTGCGKFRARFGAEALRYINSTGGRAQRLRGMNARIVESGTVRTGDAVRKL